MRYYYKYLNYIYGSKIKSQQNYFVSDFPNKELIQLCKEVKGYPLKFGIDAVTAEGDQILARLITPPDFRDNQHPTSSGNCDEIDRPVLQCHLVGGFYTTSHKNR